MGGIDQDVFKLCSNAKFLRMITGIGISGNSSRERGVEGHANR
jgi:hypothetical protein